MRLTPAPRGYPIKLVRDRTPDILNASGEAGELWYEPASLEDLDRWLRLKLAEEVAEFLVGGEADELADIYAVVIALGSRYGVDLERMAAEDERGGFYVGMMMLGRHPEFDGRE